MTCNTRITVKPGDDISWSGRITQTGVTDFTGYVLTSQVWQRNDASDVPATKLADATIAWLDATTGTFTLTIARSITIAWPAGKTLLIDVRVQDPAGLQVRTETASFQTVAGVTA